MLSAYFTNGALTLGLAAAIGAERSDRIILAIRRPLGAVEDIVGRNVDERHAGCGGGRSEKRRSIAIDAKRLLGFCLSLVDGGVSRGVDDRERRMLTNRPPDGIFRADIGGQPVKTCGQLRCAADERAANLTIRSKDQNLSLHHRHMRLRDRRDRSSPRG